VSRFPEQQVYSNVLVPFHPVRGRPEHNNGNEVHDCLCWSKCTVHNGDSTQSQQES